MLPRTICQGIIAVKTSKGWREHFQGKVWLKPTLDRKK